MSTRFEWSRPCNRWERSCEIKIAIYEKVSGQSLLPGYSARASHMPCIPLKVQLLRQRRDSTRHTDHQAPWWQVLIHQCASANETTLSDGYTRYDSGASTHHDVVFQRGAPWCGRGVGSIRILVVEKGHSWANEDVIADPVREGIYVWDVVRLFPNARYPRW